MSFDWTGLPHVTVNAKGASVLLRPLTKSDEPALGDYFVSLLPETKRVYGPHPFDRATAASICAALDTPDGNIHLRLIGLHEGRIAAYFIIHLGLRERDKARRYQDWDPVHTCVIAPSVADAWQNSGLGSQMMTYTRDCVRRFGMRAMVLWGGVREANVRAVHFYRKFGFKVVGEFLCTVRDTGLPEQINNYDMAVEL